MEKKKKNVKGWLKTYSLNQIFQIKLMTPILYFYRSLKTNAIKISRGKKRVMLSNIVNAEKS